MEALRLKWATGRVSASAELRCFNAFNSNHVNASCPHPFDSMWTSALLEIHLKYPWLLSLVLLYCPRWFSVLLGHSSPGEPSHANTTPSCPPTSKSLWNGRIKRFLPEKMSNVQSPSRMWQIPIPTLAPEVKEVTSANSLASRITQVTPTRTPISHWNPLRAFSHRGDPFPLAPRGNHTIEPPLLWVPRQSARTASLRPVPVPLHPAVGNPAIAINDRYPFCL